MRAWSRTRALTVRTVREFFDDGCTQRAAAISYYALLSLFPLVILAVALLSAVADTQPVRDQVIDFVLNRVPLRAEAGREQLRDLLRTIAGHAAGVGVFGAVGLVLGASGVMSAIRHGLNAAWDVEDPRPPLQGKAIDLVLVAGFGLAAAASLGLSLAVSLTASLADRLAEWLGTGVPVTAVAWGARLVPLALSGAIVALLFAIVPAHDTRLRDTWPGILVFAAGFEATKLGFSAYLEHFARYDAVYASLGTVVATLVFVWLTGCVLLLAAEAASEWPRLPAEA